MIRKAAIARVPSARRRAAVVLEVAGEPIGQSVVAPTATVVGAMIATSARGAAKAAVASEAANSPALAASLRPVDHGQILVT